MKTKNIFWGFFFICSAVLIVTYPLGFFNGIGLLNLIFTILLLPVILKSIPRLNFFGILFPTALLLIIFEKLLGIEKITPWPLLFAALFLSIGLELIFKRKKHYGFCHKNVSETVDNIDDNDVNCTVSFGSASKFLNSSSLQKAYFKCSFGALKVYFDNAQLHPDGAEIFIDTSFSGVELYIPQSWAVNINVDATFGGVDEKFRRPVSSGPVLTLSGNISFSGIEVIYV